MKRKWTATAAIFLFFLGFAWHTENNDKRIKNPISQNKGIVTQQVNFESIEEASEKVEQKIGVQKPFGPREYIRIIPSKNIELAN